MKKTMILLMAVIVMAAFMPATAFAGTKTVEMKVYNSIIKKGNTVYCASDGGVFKVKVKKGKVKSVKRIENEYSGNDYFGFMKVKGDYLYYCVAGGVSNDLKRAKISNGKVQMLENNASIDGYVIKDKKIYYTLSAEVEVKDKHRVMKLDGSEKKATKVKAKVHEATKNAKAKGYKVIGKEKNGYYITYLKTPKGKYKLGKANVKY